MRNTTSNLKCTVRPSALLPQATTTPYFTVTGRVVVTQIIGEVTVELGNVDVNNMKLISNPTVGAGDVDLCSVLDIGGAVVGTLLTITGTIGAALLAPAYGAVQAQATNIIIPAGTIDLSCSHDEVGQTKWTILWYALDPGSILVVV